MRLCGKALLVSFTLMLVPGVAWSETLKETSNPERTEEITVVEANLRSKVDELLPDLTEEEFKYLATLMKADELYQRGNKDEARSLYQQVKPSFSSPTNLFSQKPYSDLEMLSPGGKVYWRYGQEAFDPQLETKTLSPLKLLVEKHPEFIPGHVRYAEALVFFGNTNQGITHLETAVSRYPKQLSLVEALLPLYTEKEQWLDASLTARQFALLNADHSQANDYQTLADEHLEKYENQLRSKLRENAFASIITGALSYALTGSLAGPFSALQSTALLLQGESGVGDSLSSRLQQQLPLLEDKEVNEYVTEIGETLTQYTGRDTFDYEFYIIMDENLNAFALPGGKIFINAGAILKTKSEAELAGLIAHELSHAVLSHGFQLVTEGNLLANVTQIVPYGRTAANIIVLNYSRQMERQADELGTRLLASSKYAADGVYNLMVTLEEENKDQPHPPAWLSTHPDTEERVNNVKTQIIENGYDRYAYEGIDRHQVIQETVANLLAKYQIEQEKD